MSAPAWSPLAFAVTLIACEPAHAGASLLVDDAGVTPAGRCQLETWLRAYTPGAEFTAAPACNVGGTEIGLGFSEFWRPQQGPLVNLGLKRSFRDFDTHPWGVGVSIGATWSAELDRLGGWTVTFPLSFALDAERRAVVHANLGWNEPQGVPGAITAGLGLELVLGADWLLLGEVLADDRGAFAAQGGLRRGIGENASLDLLFGHLDGLDNGPWLTLGFNLVLPQ